MPVLPAHAPAVTPDCPASSRAWGATRASREQSTARAALALPPAGSRPGVCFVGWGGTGTALPSPPLPIRLPLSPAWLEAAGRAGQRVRARSWQRVSPRDGPGTGVRAGRGAARGGGRQVTAGVTAGGERLGAGWGGGGSWAWGERAGGGWAGTRCEDFLKNGSFSMRLTRLQRRGRAQPLRPGTATTGSLPRAAGLWPPLSLGPQSTAGCSALSPGEPCARPALPVPLPARGTGPLAACTCSGGTRWAPITPLGAKPHVARAGWSRGVRIRPDQEPHGATIHHGDPCRRLRVGIRPSCCSFSWVLLHLLYFHGFLQ